MNTKTFYTIYIAACVLLCSVLAVAMLWHPSAEPVGNETAVSWPQLQDAEGAFNTEILSDMGNYFEHHYAFRPQLITADARIQASVFGVSNTDSVITGRDGWLYYHSTLPDYMGQNPLSDRAMYNLAHNLSIVQKYASSRGAGFQVMIPPNKNSLYPQHMPYYESAPADAVHNRDSLAYWMDAAGVSYLDLFALFEAQEEELYLKEDSHWNRKGAMMVAKQLFAALEKEPADYLNSTPSYEPLQYGDLSRMLYPAYQTPEYDYVYDLPETFSYIANPGSSDPVSVEDFRIETDNAEAKGSLLMYRDSFGNTLIPILADAFGHAYFSKTVPYTVARDMDLYAPDTVVIELVERNIKNLASNPAVLPAPQADPETLNLQEVSPVAASVQSCMADISYVSFSGIIPDEAIEETQNIYLSIPDAEGSPLYYEAFTVSSAESDYGYAVYLPVSRFESLEHAQQLPITVFVGKS